MSGHFITNQERLLSELIISVLPKTENLYFLVGYFYFSGFEQIYKDIENKPLKVLVGMDIEKDIINKVKEYEVITEQNLSRGQKKDNFNHSFVELFNETDFFDSDKKQEAFKIFVNKIKDGTLEIRKTEEPNHAKLYLFEHYQKDSDLGSFPGTLITGSSNLTASGLSRRHEFNIILRDESDFKQGKLIFNELWENAIVIADKEHITEFETGIIEKIWFEKLYKPYYIFIRVLHEYFSIEYEQIVKLPAEITKNKFFDLKYQSDAIKEALKTIKNHNGVIVADVVGLGKSIIASAVAHNLGLKTIVIAPPHLVMQWDDEYRDYFNFNAKVFSSGSINKALEYYNDHYDGEERLIIIDEAHKYRNEMTQDYADLHKICQGNKVVLLSATPFNNRPQDIFSMVKLFQVPARSTLQTVNNLSYEFTRLIQVYDKLTKAQKNKTRSEKQIAEELDYIALQIRNIISPLVIRRSRIDLKEIEDYKDDIAAQGIEFPEVKPPDELQYNLGHIETLYRHTLERIASDSDIHSFQATRYKPVKYLKNPDKYRRMFEDTLGNINMFEQSQDNISNFMRHLLVRRFESSVFAFKSTLESMINSSKNILNWYLHKHKVPIFKKGTIPIVEDYDNTDQDATRQFDEVIENLKEKGLLIIKAEDIIPAFENDLKADIVLLEAIQKEWFSNGIEFDPKLEAFGELLRNQIKKEPRRKIIVFSEFSDTVNYLAKNLPNDLRIFKYTSADANKTNKETIRLNFDAGLQKNKQANDFDILLATDAISEGYNLHRAGTIINYDIPYNPTRVIQRVGRINRINKKVFDKLFIYNYFPTETGEVETRTKEISTLKIAMIHALLGEDTKILTKNEQLKSYFKEQYKQLEAQNEERSWENPYLNIYNAVRNSDINILEEALKIPIRSRIRRTKPTDKKGVLVMGKKGNDLVFKLGTSPKENKAVSPAEALELFNASVAEDAQKVSINYEAIYGKIKQDLFTKKAQTETTKNEVIDKIKLSIKNKLSVQVDYLKDMIAVIELDGLPKHFLNQISKAKATELDKLKPEIPQHYLTKILKRVSSMDEAPETLIISEELI